MHDVVRRLLIILLLVTSHGFALWWGSRTPRNGSDDTSAALAEAAADKGPELRRILSEFRADRAAVERKEEEDKKTLAARIEQARSLIRSGDDAAGMVREAIRRAEKPDAEVLAAFGLWLEHDPAAALREIQDQMTTGHWQYREEIARHFGRQGLAKLQELLDVAPKSKRILLISAYESLPENGGVELALEAAAGLRRQRDRLELLNYGSTAEKMRGHLGQAAGLFDKAGAVAFLGGLQLGPQTDLAALQEEARNAGFPPEALAALDRAAKPSEWEAEGVKNGERLARVKEQPGLFAEAIAKELEDRGQVGFLQTRDTFRGDGWKVVAPDFEEWQTEVARGALDPAGLYAKLMETVPGSERISEPLLASAALASFGAEPVKTIEWLKQTGPDWMEIADAVVQSNISSSETAHSTEIYAAIFGGYQELPETLLDRLSWSFHRPADPEPYEAIFRQLPDGALKRKLEPRMKGGSR